MGRTDLRWGQQSLGWRKWNLDEIVIDAGCGSGLTKFLARRVPRRKVYGVDIDSNMIKKRQKGILRNSVATVNNDISYVSEEPKYNIRKHLDEITIRVRETRYRNSMKS
ncbi:MAG: class I SAM-dependent methyltransferase [Thermoproteota archaeon]|nr:class I SAM-dependent methyltransferase [Thermoproteota archaeon]